MRIGRATRSILHAAASGRRSPMPAASSRELSVARHANERSAIFCAPVPRYARLPGHLPAGEMHRQGLLIRHHANVIILLRIRLPLITSEDYRRIERSVQPALPRLSGPASNGSHEQIRLKEAQ